MTSPLPIIVDSEATERKMARPEHEIALVLDKRAFDPDRASRKVNMRDRANRNAARVLARLTELGFLNDNYFVAKKAEEAGDSGRGT